MRVALLQESRADAGIYAPLIAAMERDNRFLLEIMHHSWSIVRDIERPDWVIVLGDRREMLEATIRAAYWGIPVAHIQGGDRSGTIDESCRHAITRFANLHFPCTQQSAERLLRMGEEYWRIKVVGPLGIYAMRDAPLLSKAEICTQLELDASREIILVLQHPVSTQVEQAGEQMQATLDAVRGWQTVAIYPNSDPGSEAMVRIIEACDWIHKFRNLPYLQFISLLRASKVIVGNSSTGLYEAPLFGVPAVNIGTRQQDRERAVSVINVPHATVGIREAINAAIAWQWFEPDRFRADIDGVQVILDTLATTPVDERLLQKSLTY